MKYVLVGAAAFAIWYFIQQKNKLVKSVSMDTIKVHKIKFDKKKSESMAYTTLYFQAELKCENKSDITATINSVDLTAKYNGNKLATAKANSSIEIPAHTIKSVGVNFSVPVVGGVLGIINAVKALIAGQPLNIDINGSVVAFGQIFPVDQKLPVTLAA